MPFGLCSAPATLQMLMERCMGDINLRDCLVYLDIIIFSASFQEHTSHLEAVFERLQEQNLKLKPSKCEFFRDQVLYLSHVVFQEGIRTDPAKIEAVKPWPIPKCTKDVRKFLGFTGYYRRFIKGYAATARPLNDLLVGYATNPKAKQKKRRLREKWSSMGWRTASQFWYNHQQTDFPARPSIYLRDRARTGRPSVRIMWLGIMSSVWDMILQWGSTIKVSIELPVATRHRRDMTEKLLKAALNPNSHTPLSRLPVPRAIQRQHRAYRGYYGPLQRDFFKTCSKWPKWQEVSVDIKILSPEVVRNWPVAIYIY